MSQINKIRNKIQTVLSVSLISAALTGCGSTGVKQQDAQYLYATGGYNAVAANYLNDKGELDTRGSGLETLLVSGKALHDSGNWEESSKAFELAEKELAWKADTVDTPAEIGKLLGTTMTNDTLASYNGKIFEGVMLDYYQALNYLMMGDESSARVRFNRLQERQRNAETQLRKYTETLSESTDDVAAENQEQNLAIQKARNETETELQKGLAALPADIKANEIRNPAGDLLGAVFRGTSASRTDKMGGVIEGMIDSAATKGVSSESRELARKLETELKNQNTNHVFVIFEDGQGPSIEEFRVDLPVFLVSQNVLYSGIALPEFKPGTPVHRLVRVQNGAASESLSTVSDINRIASLEFDADYEGKVAKAVASSVIKTIAQGVINNQIDNRAGNELLGFFMKTAVAATQSALTKADTRSWYNLPDSIRFGVLPRSSDQKMHLTTESGDSIALVNLPAGNSDLLVYARRASANGEVKVYAQELPAESLASEL